MSDEIWSIKKLLDWSTDYFNKAAIDSPRLESEILLSHALGLKRIDLYIKFDQQPNKDQLSRFKEYLKRRRDHEPSAYITGSRSFMSLDFKVSRDVLIPRPETELLVETAMDIAKDSNPPEVLDIGTGSGAVAVSIVKYIEGSHVHATDISDKALAVAKENADRFNMSDRIVFEKADIFPANPDKKFDMILSNPPYIRSNDISALQAEVKDFEPHGALDGGADGLKYYRSILMSSKKFLKEHGHIILEIDPGLSDQLKILSKENGFTGHNVRKDLRGMERVAIISD